MRIDLAGVRTDRLDLHARYRARRADQGVGELVRRQLHHEVVDGAARRALDDVDAEDVGAHFAEGGGDAPPARPAGRAAPRAADTTWRPACPIGVSGALRGGRTSPAARGASCAGPRSQRGARRAMWPTLPRPVLRAALAGRARTSRRIGLAGSPKLKYRAGRLRSQLSIAPRSAATRSPTWPGWPGWPSPTTSWTCSPASCDVILGAVARVGEVAAADIPPTSHAVPMTNVFRPDEVGPCLPRDAVLAAAPARRGRQVPGAAHPGRGSSERDRADAAERGRDRRRDRAGEVVGGRGRPRRISTGSPRSTRRCTPSCTSTPTARCAAARRSTTRRAAGDELGPLAGVPLAMKDVVVTKGLPTTAGSKILEGWLPPYDATITRRDQGRRHRHARQDQHGRVRDGLLHGELRVRPDAQPVGPRPHPGRLVRAARRPRWPRSRRRWRIGTDTGGSIRQPAAVTGIVGHKPTYGGVSRYGLIAFSSSLDQAGPFGRTVLDAALLHEVMAGHDPCDSTSIPTRRCRRWSPRPATAPRGDLDRRAGRRGARTRRRGLPARRAGRVPRRPSTRCASLGAEVVEVSCPHFDYALAAYYLIAPSECSSNLARFDAVRYGLRVGDDGVRSLEEVMSLTREAGFGAEVKRRIMIGTYALSSGLLRRLLRPGAEGAHADRPGLRGRLRDRPTCWSRRPRRSSRSASASASTTRWRCTSTTCARCPPRWPARRPSRCRAGCPTGLPVGLQVMAPALADDRCYRVAAAFEAAHGREHGPILRTPGARSCCR